MPTDKTSLARQIESALGARAELKSADIKVRVDEGKVTLTGAVDEARKAALAEKLAKAADGVKDVENKLTVKK